MNVSSTSHSEQVNVTSVKSRKKITGLFLTAIGFAQLKQATLPSKKFGRFAVFSTIHNSPSCDQHKHMAKAFVADESILHCRVGPFGK
jgi:hypothetical protein